VKLRCSETERRDSGSDKVILGLNELNTPLSRGAPLLLTSTLDEGD
jgi:hypothetical protein